MRILITCHTPADRDTGAFGVTYHFGEQLKSQGAHVDYFTFDNMPRWLQFRFKYTLFPLWVFFFVLRNRSFDILYSTTADTWLLGMVRGRARTPKITVASHGLEHMLEASKERGIRFTMRYAVWLRFHLWCVARSLKDADHVFVLTKHEKDYMAQHFAISSERISQVSHPLPKYFRGLPAHVVPKEFKILFVGSWLPRKGITYLIEACNLFVTEIADFSISLVGVRMSLDEIKGWFPQRLHTRIRVIPSLEHNALPKVYQEHSVFLFPSLFEGFGRVLQEAMACGMPVITTPVGIAKEWVKDNVNGLLVPMKDAAAIAQRLAWVFHHPQEAKVLGERAQAFIHTMQQDQGFEDRFKVLQQLLPCVSGKTL
ncbi:MAG: glycosyltransferase family 4 protein [Candidatus Omnitrophica bacterium]|nr:glycosyltransferase family 4 protein [Candidatus Omnitrophota bacterium]